MVSRSFVRAYKRRVRPGSPRHGKIQSRIGDFINDPFLASLKTHKLSGRLKDYWSFTVEYDLRVIFYFEDPETAVFIDFGTHDEVYGQ